MPPTTHRPVLAFVVALVVPSVANASPRHRATVALTDSHETTVHATGDEGCHDTGRTVAAGVDDHVRVLEDTYVRTRIGRDSPRDPSLPRGTTVVVHAVDRADHAMLVQDPHGHTGWVGACEIAGVARRADDVVEAIAAGPLLSRTSGGRTIMPIAIGTHLTVRDWDGDWVRVEAPDGMRGWFRAARLETITRADTDAVWTPGLVVRWSCKGKHHDHAGALRCGEEELRVVTTELKTHAPRVLLAAPDGRWGWVGDRLEAVEAEPAVPEPTEPTPTVSTDAATDTVAKHDEPKPAPKSERMADMADMAGMDMDHPMAATATTDKTKSSSTAAPAHDSSTAAPAHEMVMAGMDMGAPAQGASLSLSLQTAMPFGDAMAADPSMPMRTPRYEANVTATGGGRINDDFEYGLTATFAAGESLRSDGQAMGDQYQGGQGTVTVTRRLTDHAKLTVGGGYALAFVSPGAMADAEWDFIAIHPGPYVKVSLTGDLSKRWSYSVFGTAQWTTGTDGMTGTILVGDAMTMASLTSWASLRLDAMAMEMAMGDTMTSASPSLSFAFLDRLSATVGVTGMQMDGMTMWTATTGLGAHF